MGGARRRVSLQLPPNLAEEPSGERALQGPVFLLLPEAMNRLRQLCSVQELRLGRVVGRGEIPRMKDSGWDSSRLARGAVHHHTKI